MCLVEVEKSIKPIASCALSLTKDIKFYTNTKLVKKARENVLEFLLANHPLDCPICDQGGECDLQDQVIVFGGDRGRFYEVKRTIENKNCGPLIKTIMTRCIHCTRCIRFLNEIASTSFFGTTGRGLNMEIGTYVEKIITSELSANIIDLCPVGALTSKPYSFMARPWELKNVLSIDIFDAIGSNIKIDFRGYQILRILPILNNKINQDWITDKVRYCYDGLQNQRILSPIKKFNNNFINISWYKAYSLIKRTLSFKKIKFIAGDLIETELLLLSKNFANNFGSSATLQSDFSFFKTYSIVDFRSNFLLNRTLTSIENNDLYLFINTNLRLEAPLLNIRIKKNFNKNNIFIAVIGNILQLGYYYKNIGVSSKNFLSIIEGTHWICKLFVKSKNPLIFFGFNNLTFYFINSFNIFIKLLNFFIKSVKFFSFIIKNSAILNALEIGYVIGINYLNLFNITNNNYYLLGVDTYSINNKNNFIIYQGHHSDINAKNASILLPGSTFIEKISLYMNIEGFFQKTNFVFVNKNQTRNDWKIIIALSEYIQYKNPIFNNINNIIINKIINKLSKLTNRFFIKNLNSWFIIEKKNMYIDNSKKYILNNLFINNLREYYKTSSIFRFSKLMTLCQQLINKINYNFLQKC